MSARGTRAAGGRGAVRVAILGTGGMARHHARSFAAVPGCRLVACADIDRARAEAFAAEHRIPRVYGGIEELLAGGDLDAVSIVTPDALHAPQALRCLRAGQHVLCEKPLALSHRDARRMVRAAEQSGRVAMVNLSYRDWPALQAVATLVRAGRLGAVRHVEASYLQSWLVGQHWGDWRTSAQWLWRLSRRHGSRGVLGDVGVHIVDFAMFPVGPIRRVACRLQTFPKAPGNRIGAYRLDANDSAVLAVEFANGALGSIHATRWSVGHQNRLYLKISGTQGAVEIDSERATDRFRICSGPDVHRGRWRDVGCRPTPTNYQRFIRAIRRGRPDQPDFATGAAVQRVLDACERAHATGRMVTLSPAGARRP